MFEKENPEDNRPRLAIEALYLWIREELEMVQCRRAAFGAHAAARDAKSEASVSAARATGQAAAVAHVYTHAPHAANYAAKAVGLSGEGGPSETAKMLEREWQWENLEIELRAIGFPGGK